MAGSFLFLLSSFIFIFCLCRHVSSSGAVDRHTGSVPESLLTKDRDKEGQIDCLGSDEGLCVTLAPV